MNQSAEARRQVSFPESEPVSASSFISISRSDWILQKEAAKHEVTDRPLEPSNDVA